MTEQEKKEVREAVYTGLRLCIQDKIDGILIRFHFLYAIVAILSVLVGFILSRVV